MRRRRVLTAALLSLAAAAPLATAAPAPTEADEARPLGQVVPAPASVDPGGESFTLREDARIHVPAGSPGARAIAGQLAGLLRPPTGYALPVTRDRADDGIVLALDARGATGAEGYTLRSTARSLVIRAATPAGLFHGVQTLRQLLPADVERRYTTRRPWTVAGGTISDAPRYGYRGAMLDVARHFFTVDEVERYIDQLALYKINRLHLHLTDDQGWRIAVDGLPRLASRGGSTEVGGGPGGFYTKADYRQLVAYAGSRYMTVVPEIDMPGHTNAALASYAGLNCDGVARELYTGTAVGFSSLCVPKPATSAFVDTVLREVAAMTPGPYLHIGGDEARATPHAEYVALMDRAQAVVRARGKTVVGWHQMTGAHPVPGAVAQYWGTGSEDQAAVAAAARAGTRLVLSPANHAYLDMKYDADTSLGTSWAGRTDVRSAYDWDPAGFVRGAPAESVLGVEAPLWSETITGSADIEYMSFPRLPAVAELGWTPAARTGWPSFRERLAAQGPRWSAMGVNFYAAPGIDWPPGGDGPGNVAGLS
ncbi:beta-N-acetylhexosaminidase [Streptomyces sp. NPDC001070]